MKKRILIIIAMIFTLSILHAQYDEKAIMTQNAQQLFYQRQYSQAEQAWLAILQKYPNDIVSISQLFQLYLQISQHDKAAKLIDDYYTVIPEKQRMEYEIQLLVNQAKLKEALEKTAAYIQLGTKEDNRYRITASYFEQKGFYEQALKIYEQGRQALNNPNIFSMEMGNCAFNSHVYDKAMIEYVRFLEAQPGNLYFVSNQLKSILEDNPDLITQLRNLAKASSSFEIKEIYAISLSRMGRLKEALAEYEQLPLEKLYAFANEQYSTGKDSLAALAYRAVMSRQPDVNMQGEVFIRLGELYTKLKQYSQADSVLSNVVNIHNNKVNPLFERRKFVLQAYMILADLAQWQGKSISDITGIYTAARKYAYQPEDITELDYRLIATYYANDEIEQAEDLLNKQSTSQQTDKLLYYKYLIAMARLNPEKADSLLNDLMIAAPSSKYVNDLMTINILIMNLSKPAQTGFYQAYRYKLSHRDSLAIMTVYELSQTTKDEELRILAADWSVSAGFNAQADSLYNYSWQDETLKEYASLQRSRLQGSIISAESMAQEFLKSNPNSAFSPSFRQILQKAPNGRPNL